MKPAALISLAVLTLGQASAATVQTSQTIEITGAAWNAGVLTQATPGEGGTVAFTGIGNGSFTVTVATTENSTGSVDGTGFHLISNVSSSFSSVMLGVTGLRNTATYQDRVAWFEIDVADFDLGDGSLTYFMGVSSFGVEVSNDTGLGYTESGGLVPYGSQITAIANGSGATLHFTSYPGMPFGGAVERSATMAWLHTAIGTDLQITGVRVGIETLETVPEPSTPILIGSLGLLGLLRRRK